ncbi:MAG: hypothetical protein JWO81_1746 [Alphaproteobacteria bacterium]|nr:hypothetical protein [Alphaproteobacteria bacterium]
MDAHSAEVSITLGDGRILSSAAPVPILNRLSFVPTAELRATAGADYGYAVQELYALYLSWLHAWPAAVVNRPSPQGLAGSYRHPSQWALLAARAGLPALPWEQSSADTPESAWMAPPGEAIAYAVAGEAVLPPVLAGDLAGPCLALAALAGTALLGIAFVRDGEGWLMSGAMPVPDLMLGGAPLADALARALS